MASEEERSMEEELSYPILLTDRIRKAAEEANSFKSECSEVMKQVETLSQMLRSIARLATSYSSTSSTSSTSVFYERPVRRILHEVEKTLPRALNLVRKAKRTGVLRRVVTITSATDFRKLITILDGSVADMQWLISVFESCSANSYGIVLSLPPICSNDPILAWVWSYIAAIQMSSSFNDRVEAANALASHAVENDRNKKIIVEEGAIPPLLKLLKEIVSPEAQVASATALASLATDQEKVSIIVAEGGVASIVQVLSDSPMVVQIAVAELVCRMAENDPDAQEEFARENVIRPLVSLLSFETSLDEAKMLADTKAHPGKPASIHSLVLSKDLGANLHLYPKKPQHSYPHLYSEGSGGGGSSSSSNGNSRSANQKKERENEKPQVKTKLKIKCAEALWLLSRGSVSNSQRITETKGFLCLAKHVENEKGELQVNCLKALMEIAGAAELNADLRRAAFKSNHSAAKAVIDQILRVIQEEDVPSLQIPAIRAIGSLARAFQAREARIIGPLVTRLGHINQDVAVEAIIALEKFACPDNFLYAQHCKAIVELGGVNPLLLLLRSNEHAQVHGLTLLCYLALNEGNSEAMVRSSALSALEGTSRAAVSQHPELRELIPKAIYQLELYHEGTHPHRPSYIP